MKTTIQLRSGKYFDLLKPEESELTIFDIAHALSNLCRFTGHCSEHYSVAQHCVLVSWIVPPQFALQGVLHEIGEPVLGDVSSPLKALLPEYKALERKVEAALLPRFGLPVELDPAVKAADRVALATEQRDLMPRKEGDPAWSMLRGVSPLKGQLVPLRARDARNLFLDRFFELGGRA